MKHQKTELDVVRFFDPKLAPLIDEDQRRRELDRLRAEWRRDFPGQVLPEHLR